MKQLEGIALFRAAYVRIHLDIAQGYAVGWEADRVCDIYEHYAKYGVGPVWVKGWARVARFLLEQEQRPFKPKSNWRIRKDAKNETRRKAKYGPRKRVVDLLGGWSLEFND
jgi:hypothetical protein